MRLPASVLIKTVQVSVAGVVWPRYTALIGNGSQGWSVAGTAGNDSEKLLQPAPCVTLFTVKVPVPVFDNVTVCDADGATVAAVPVIGPAPSGSGVAGVIAALNGP